MYDGLHMQAAYAAITLGVSATGNHDGYYFLIQCLASWPDQHWDGHLMSLYGVDMLVAMMPCQPHIWYHVPKGQPQVEIARLSFLAAMLRFVLS